MLRNFAILALLGIVASAADSERKPRPRFKPQRLIEEEEAEEQEEEDYLTDIELPEEQDDRNDTWARIRKKREEEQRALEEEASKIPEGWYSAELEFSPPAIEYEAEKFKTSIYTICSMKSDKFNGTVKFSQPSSKPIISKVEGKGSKDATYDFVIHENGSYQQVCESAGIEFNPLREEDIYGNYNLYQDPMRGRLESIKAD